MLILNPIFQYFKDGRDSSFTASQLRKLEEFGRWKGIYLNQAFVKLRQDGGNRAQKPVCMAGDVAIVITPENKIAMPCYHAELESVDASEIGRARALERSRVLSGRMPACEGCQINCYMEPSFAVQLNKYWLQSFPSTFKYLMEKGMVWQSLRMALGV